MRARHNLPQHQILRDPQAYIRNIGKEDRQETLEAFKREGEGVILRACIAPGEGMPLRALGYYTILERINREYFPEAEAQLVLTINAADRVNGPLKSTTRYETAQKFIEHVGFLPPHPGTLKRPQILFDTNEAPPINTHHLARILNNTPENEKLKQQAQRRGADHLTYLAAHLIMHDTVDCVQRVDSSQPKPAQSARQIISVGGKAEETFYRARMRVKAHGVCIPGEVAETGQLFTGHDTVPCYQFARQPQEGERIFDPPVSDILALRDPLLDDALRVSRRSVLRDIVYLRDYIDHVSAAETEFTNPKALAGYA